MSLFVIRELQQLETLPVCTACFIEIIMFAMILIILLISLSMASSVVMRSYNKVNFEEYLTQNQLMTLFDANQQATINLVRT
jgi:hypothetical protein